MNTSRFKRRISAAAVLTAAALTLVACGDSEPTETAGKDSYTVKHAMGTETFDKAPQRIVVIDSPHLDALVALGVEPTGAVVASAGEALPEYLGSSVAETEIVGLIAEPDVDAIANLAPDLIIGSKVRHEAIYDELDAIAPTVFSEGSGTDWAADQAAITAAAVNKSDEMDALLADLDAHAAEVGEALNVEGKTASMIRFRPDNFRVYGPETFAGSLLTKVGFDLGEREWNEYSMLELSPELYEEIDGDVVFYTDGDPEASTMKAVSKLWVNQPGIKAGSVYAVDEPTWMVGIGVVAGNIILDDIEEALS